MKMECRVYFTGQKKQQPQPETRSPLCKTHRSITCRYFGLPLRSMMLIKSVRVGVKERVRISIMGCDWGYHNSLARRTSNHNSSNNNL